jgi:pentapeptide repeat protein
MIIVGYSLRIYRFFIAESSSVGYVGLVGSGTGDRVVGVRFLGTAMFLPFGYVYQWRTPGAAGIGLGIVALLAIGIFVGYHIKGTGFGAYSYRKEDDKEEYQRYKTLWDWLQLLIVPMVLTLGGLYFVSEQERYRLEVAAEQEERQQEMADRRERAAERLAEQRAQDGMLLAYLDQMSTLLVDKDVQASEPRDPKRLVAGARTIAVVRAMDPERKRTVLRFVYEAGLIGKDRTIADLEGAMLAKADLDYAQLENADLSSTYLIEADLVSADLSGTDLSGADLADADLSGANLVGANLDGADLSGANLEDAEVTQAQLDTAGLLAMATMPDGSKHTHGGRRA